MKTIAMLLAIAMAVGSGCATRPDWIERTLVTVDVTGVWYGIQPGAGGGGARAVLWLDLQQQGPKVKGSARTSGGSGIVGGFGRIEGTISGDVFRFKQSSGTQLKGELTVHGDEMTGEVAMEGSALVLIDVLRRAGPSSRPDSQR